MLDKYIEDPTVAISSCILFPRFISSLRRIHINDNMEGTPKNLPIYILAGR